MKLLEDNLFYLQNYSKLGLNCVIFFKLLYCLTRKKDLYNDIQYVK